MFVSIDMDNLVFLHKHHDHEAISAISWLECGNHTSVRIEPSHDASLFLRGVSDLDVQMLYKNTTGQALPKDAQPAALRYQLQAAVQLMGITRLLPEQVLAQVEAVDDRLHDGERFRYAIGAKVPAQPVDLVPLRVRPLRDGELSEAASRSLTPIRGYPPRLSGEPRKPWEPEPEPTDDHTDTPAPVDHERDEQAPTRATKAPAGSAKPVIWAAAAKAWADRATGATWDAVRKAVAAKLVDDGLHATTVRIKLSEWAKDQGSALI